MKYKGIISDFDETLVGPDKVIRKKTDTAIKKLTKRGFSFSIASGRAYFKLKKYCDQLGLTSPQIFRGGAEIVDPTTGKILHSEYLQPNDAQSVIELLSKHHIPFKVERDEFAFTEIKPKNSSQSDFRPLSKLTEYSRIPKIVLISTGMDVKKVEEFVEEKIIKVLPDVHAIKSYGPTYNVWDITSAKATKQLAVFHVAELLNVSPTELVGVGDGYNDFPLLEACGLKVAVGNAVEELKAIADYIAPTNEDEGIVNVIEKYF